MVIKINKKNKKNFLILHNTNLLLIYQVTLLIDTQIMRYMYILQEIYIEEDEKSALGRLEFLVIEIL